MPDTISFEKAQQMRRRGQWQHIEVKPFGTTLKSAPWVRRWAKTKKVGMDALPILFPRGGLERSAAAKDIKEVRRSAEKIPFAK